MKQQRVPPIVLWTASAFAIFALVFLVSACTAPTPSTPEVTVEAAPTEDPPKMVFEPPNRIESPNCPAPQGYYPWGPVYEYTEVRVRDGGVDFTIGQSVEAKVGGGGVNHKIEGDNTIREGSYLLDMGQGQILPMHLCEGIIWIPGEYITECAHPEGWTNVGKTFTLTNNEGMALLKLDGNMWTMDFIGDSVNGMDIMPGTFLDVHDLPGVNLEGTVVFYMDCFGNWWIKPYDPLPMLPTPTPSDPIAPDGLG